MDIEFWARLSSCAGETRRFAVARQLSSAILRRVMVEFLCGDGVVFGSLAILFGWQECFERAYSGHYSTIYPTVNMSRQHALYDMAKHNVALKK